MYAGLLLADQQRKIIPHLLFNDHAPKAIIGQAEGIGGPGNIELQVFRIVGLLLLAVDDEHGTIGIAAADGLPSHEGGIELKGTIFNKVGVEAAIGGAVDVFEKDAPHTGFYRKAGPFCINSICYCFLAQSSTRNSQEQKNKQFFHNSQVIVTIKSVNCLSYTFDKSHMPDYNSH